MYMDCKLFQKYVQVHSSIICSFSMYSVSQTTGTVILSSQVNVQRGTPASSTSLQTRPVTLTFGILFDTFRNPSCVFWDFSNP